MNDEIITEVRALKDAIGAKYHYDLRAMFKDIKRGESDLHAKGIPIIFPPCNPAGMPNTALQRTRFARR